MSKQIHTEMPTQSTTSQNATLQIDNHESQLSSYSPLIDIVHDYSYSPLIFPCTFPQLNQQLTTEEFEKIIIETIKKEDFLPIQVKISFTYFILSNSTHFSHFKDFYEEECHLSLLNWVWEERKLFKSKTYTVPKMIEVSFLLELLYNILNIFELLPIKSNDILDLKLFEKLNKIKRFIKKRNFPSFLQEKIQTLLLNWDKQIDNNEDNNDDYLGKKRPRNETSSNEDETEADSEEVNNFKKEPCGTQISCDNNIGNKKKKNKRKVSIDLNRNTIAFFDKESEPMTVSNHKREYDPLMF